jgi:RimJ/RimL family protein N-acetyltransferase
MYGDVFENKESLLLAIRIKETGELAGLAEFYGLRDRLHKISVGGRLRENFWNQDIATETVQLMVGYLYGETDIEIITASTMTITRKLIAFIPIRNTGSSHFIISRGYGNSFRSASRITTTS